MVDCIERRRQVKENERSNPSAVKCLEYVALYLDECRLG